MFAFTVARLSNAHQNPDWMLKWMNSSCLLKDVIAFDEIGDDGKVHWQGGNHICHLFPVAN